MSDDKVIYKDESQEGQNGEETVLDYQKYTPDRPGSRRLQDLYGGPCVHISGKTCQNGKPL